MASLQFQIHTDKENPGSAGVKKVAGGSARAKSFQALKTPRRALGSVNEADRVGGRPQLSHELKNGASKPSSVLKQNPGIQKDSKVKVQQPDKENTVRGKAEEEKSSVQAAKAKQQQQSFTYCLPDIEYMPPASPRDEDEDMLPLRKRSVTYVQKFLNWRPPCFFGSMPDSEEEEEEKEGEAEVQRMMSELDNLPQLKDNDIFPPADLHLSCENLDVDSVPLPSMDDLSLPFIDEAPVDSSAPVELPMLDDSVGLVPHLGSLEILDSSLPSLPQ